MITSIRRYSFRWLLASCFGLFLYVCPSQSIAQMPLSAMDPALPDLLSIKQHPERYVGQSFVYPMWFGATNLNRTETFGYERGKRGHWSGYAMSVKDGFKESDSVSVGNQFSWLPGRELNVYLDERRGDSLERILEGKGSESGRAFYTNIHLFYAWFTIVKAPLSRGGDRVEDAYFMEITGFKSVPASDIQAYESQGGYANGRTQ